MYESVLEKNSKMPRIVHIGNLKTLLYCCHFSCFLGHIYINLGIDRTGQLYCQRAGLRICSTSLLQYVLQISSNFQGTFIASTPTCGEANQKGRNFIFCSLPTYISVESIRTKFALDSSSSNYYLNHYIMSSLLLRLSECHMIQL